MSDLPPEPKDPGVLSYVEFKLKASAVPKDDGTALELVGYKDYTKCKHHSTIVDEELSEIECATCHAKLNPIWVLLRMAHEESRFAQRRRALIEERKRWEKKSKVLCRGCNKFVNLR